MPATYLGINAAFGVKDCAELPIDAIDGGYHNFARAKTAVKRRAPLWPQCQEALSAIIGKRTSGLVFDNLSRDCIDWRFRKLLKTLGIKGNFYSLRRCVETYGVETGLPHIVDFIMGHTQKGMGAHYREEYPDAQVARVTDHMRAWLNSGES